MKKCYKSFFVFLLVLTAASACFGAAFDYKVDSSGRIYGYDVISKGPWVDVRAYGAVGDGTTDDGVAIIAAVSAVQGKFIMSINDISQIRKLYEGFNFDTMSTVYSVSKEGKQRGNELLISNY